MLMLVRIAILGINVLYGNFNCGFSIISTNIRYDYLNLFLVFLVFECEVLVVLMLQSVKYILMIVRVTYVELIYRVAN